MYKLDCEFCGETIESETLEPVKMQAKSHLEENHYEDLLIELTGQDESITCRNGCGYEIPVGGGDVAGLNCPNCGHDNLSSLVRLYIFWRIQR